MIKSIYYLLRSFGKLGLFGAIKFSYAYLFGSTVVIRPKGYSNDLEVRGKTSDIETFFSIIVGESYPKLGGDVRTIIDAGANVGYSASYFSFIYPKAQILAIEPEGTNFAQLTSNTKSLKNVTPIKAALWSNSSNLYIDNPDAQSWSFRFSERESQNESESIQAVTVSELINQYELGFVDILKIDIEGGEKEVFSHNTDWISDVNTIYIEIHDWIVSGSAKQIFRAMDNFNYDFELYYEYVSFSNINQNQLTI